MTEKNEKKISGQEPEDINEIVMDEEQLVSDLAMDDGESEGNLSEDEISQLPTVSRKIYWGVYSLIALMILGLIFGTVRLFPFYNKIEGTWVSEEQPTYELKASGDTASFIIKNVQETDFISLTFTGDLVRVGSNRYRMKDVDCYLNVEKDGASMSDLTALKEQKAFYSIVEDTEEALKLAYTEEALESAFHNDLETMFYFTLENFKYELIGQDLRVRSETLSQNSFVMTKK